MIYVIARIKDDFASEIAKSIDIFQAITWVIDAWKEVNVDTIMSCFAKRGITEETNEYEDDIVNEELNAYQNYRF